MSLSAATATSAPTAVFKQYCYACHGKAGMGGLKLEEIAAKSAFGDDFHHWRKVVAALEDRRMPPAKMPQPTDAQRKEAIDWVRARLDAYARRHAGAPGRVTMRRLTSGEYGYTIEDLTGLKLPFDRDFVADSVGGEGFTNYGDVQFTSASELDRYLEAARKVASHAVVGSGPLTFFEHPGKSGFEMSAAARIQEIYRAHGFRSVAGEGAKPYGLDRYAKALYAAWRFRHRAALGEPDATLDAIAKKEGISARFAQHIWDVLSRDQASYPISDVIARWKAIGPQHKDPRAASVELQRFVTDWARMLFAAGPLESAVGDDRIFLLDDATLKVKPSETVRFFVRPPRGQKTTRVHLTATKVNPNAQDNPTLTWRNGVTRVRRRQGSKEAGLTDKPLAAMLDAAAIERLGVKDGAFQLSSGGSAWFDLEVPPDAFALELQITVELPAEGFGDTVVRATVSDNAEFSKGRTSPVLLGYPNADGYRKWKAGLMEFAAALPQNSHGEPTPSDRDPIPAPFDNTYNQPERNRFHAKVKYFRTDSFLRDKVLDDAARLRLDQAWNDLLASFDYHDQLVAFVNDKYKAGLAKTSIAALTETEIAALPEEPRRWLSQYRAEYDGIQKALRAAQPGHVNDALRLATLAWRRPLTAAEQNALRGFYRKTAATPELDHAGAVRALLARVLVAPAFLYRIEAPSAPGAARALTDWELATRLSYFLWSSMPDAELRRAAAARELTAPGGLAKQARRMLADPKARRLATEFFGQWLGFYRFDQHRGVDVTRFPEFNDELRSSMYDEATSFFEHIVRRDRPVREMFDADYTYLTPLLAKHYGVKKDIKAGDEAVLVEGAREFQRGGMFRLGAVLTATSAPLRTSPVKRGDWVLRRVLGTPTPPPPADAGSIPADEKLFGGLSLAEKLKAHQRNATCAGCHTRIDPLGFPLERYDAVGRWRDKYADGKPVADAATLFDKTPINGVDGLVKYVQSQERQVLHTFTTKLLGYALGRTALLSDQPLIDTLTAPGGDAKFSTLAAGIVASRQFRYRLDEGTHKTK